MQFDIEPGGRHLASGGEDGAVRLYDLAEGRQVASFAAAADTVNGCSFHPALPLLATASGERVYPTAGLFSDSEAEDEAASEAGGAGWTNALRVWQLPSAAAAAAAEAVEAADAAEGGAAAAELEAAVELEERKRAATRAADAMMAATVDGEEQRRAKRPKPTALWKGFPGGNPLL